jgi:hypothetical protein
MGRSSWEWQGLASQCRREGYKAMPEYATSGKVTTLLLVEIDDTIERQERHATTPNVSALRSTQAMADILAFRACVMKRVKATHDKHERRRIELNALIPKLREEGREAINVG